MNPELARQRLSEYLGLIVRSIQHPEYKRGAADLAEMMDIYLEVMAHDPDDSEIPPCPECSPDGIHFADCPVRDSAA